MKLHCFDVTFNPTNYELSDSVAATKGVLLYSGFPIPTCRSKQSAVRQGCEGTVKLLLL